MTKTLLKNTFREIANSKARFISILAIIALGVGFFAGIKATVPSMYNMADEYYSQSNLMDYRLVSTVGFDKDDVKAVENLDNVTDVMPSYFADLVLKSNGNGGNGKVIRVTAAPKSYNNNKTLNTLNIKEGRLPEKKGEILVEYGSVGSSENLWEPINAEYNALKTGETNLEEFDGGNHTICNLYVDNVTNKTNTKGYYYGGLFYVLNGTVKDLTIDGATVTCFRGAALIGRLDAGLVENCHVKNAKIYSEQKAGGLAGYVNNSSQDLIIRGCSASDITLDKLSSMDEAYMMGGFIGYLQSYERNTLIENNSVSNIAINYIYTSPDEVTDKVADMEQTYCHAFIGNVINTSKKDESYNKYSVVLKNNRVDKQLENAVTCDRTNNYIGWWAGDYNLNGNNISYSTKLVIDGEIMDRWIEVKRVANLLRTGGDISIYRYVDLTKNNESSQEINITAETVLTLEKNAVLIVGKQQVNNKSKLTVKGAGAMKATDYLLMNETGAELIIEGGNFTATSATDANGVAVYNQGKCTVNSGVFDAPGFTLMNTGNADMTITGGTVKCGGIKTGYALMAAGSAAKLTVSGGDIEAIQSIGGAQVNISGGSVYCEGTYYALYNGGGNTSISGGYFYSPTGKNIYVASGTVKTTGGYFSDKSAPLESGYKFQDVNITANGNQYNYQVVSGQ